MLDVKKSLSKIVTRFTMSPIVAVCYRGSSDTAVNLTTSNQIIGCPNNYTTANDEFAYTTDGGIRILKGGLVIVFGWAMFESVTSGDMCACAIGSYRSGAWRHQGANSFSTESSTTRTIMALTATVASPNDNIYVRARNNGGARGSVTYAKLIVFKVGG